MLLKFYRVIFYRLNLSYNYSNLVACICCLILALKFSVSRTAGKLTVVDLSVNALFGQQFLVGPRLSDLALVQDSSKSRNNFFSSPDISRSKRYSVSAKIVSISLTSFRPFSVTWIWKVHPSVSPVLRIMQPSIKLGKGIIGRPKLFKHLWALLICDNLLKYLDNLGIIYINPCMLLEVLLWKLIKA